MPQPGSARWGFFGVFADGQGWLFYRRDVGGTQTSWSGRWTPPDEPGTYRAYVEVTGVEERGKVVCSEVSLAYVRVNAVLTMVDLSTEATYD